MAGPILPILRVVVCGSVDDGKSTLIGRLLAETGTVPDDQLDYARRTRRGGSTVPAGEVDYSLLTDGLAAEHQQGITIDVAHRYLDLSPDRRVIIADAPGHPQYTRNMAVASSTADAGVLLVDATRGIRPQTHRHLAVCALMRVGTVIAVINKLDAVGYDHAEFERLAGKVRTAAARFDLADVPVIPVSALGGDNVAAPSRAMPWYHGPTLLGALSSAFPAPEATGEFRLPVQHVIRADGFRGVAGTVASGSLRPGDPVVVAGTGAASTVGRVLGPNGELDRAGPDTPVTVTLTGDVDVGRGDLLTTPRATRDELAPATAFSTTLVWTGQEPLRHGRSYLLLAGPRTVPAVVTTVRGRLDVVSGKQIAARTLEINDIGTVELTTDVPVPLDGYATSRDTGNFLLADRVSKDTVAAGIVRYALRRGRNIVPHAYTVDRSARQRLKGQRAAVLWLTGLPGAGKSTIADALERRLHAMGLHTYVLDGDNVRSGLNKDLGFTPEDRAENVRRVAETARLLLDAGLIVIVALVSPFRADRAMARALFEPGDFIEVWVDTPADVCAARDPKGLYAKAKAGTLPNLTGVGQAYEPPEHPDLVVDGTAALDATVDRLAAVVPLSRVGPMDIRELDRRALQATDRAVAKVTGERLDAPTPCAEWDLRALLVHMAGNNNGFADAAEGKPADPGVWRGAGLDRDPVGAYRESARRVAAAFAGDDVLDRTFELHGFGSYPGRTAIGMHFIDYLVHGWDVARAIGADHELDPELCRAVLRMGERWPKDSPDIWGPGAPFGHPVPVPDDAPPDQRMLGFLGRSPAWPRN